MHFIFKILMVGLWFLTPISAIVQLYHGGQFYWWRKPEYAEITTKLSQFIVKLVSHNVVSNTARLSGIRTHNFRKSFDNLLTTAVENNLHLFLIISHSSNCGAQLYMLTFETAYHNINKYLLIT